MNSVMHRKQRKGMSLLEVMVALSIATIMLAGVAQLTLASSTALVALETQNVLNEYAISLGDRIKALPYGSKIDPAPSDESLRGLLELDPDVLASVSFHALRNADDLVFRIYLIEGDGTRPPIRITLGEQPAANEPVGEYLGLGKVSINNSIVPGSWNDSGGGDAGKQKRSAYAQLNAKPYLYRIRLTLTMPGEEEEKEYVDVLRSYMR
ncbi:prepilin-type N-terminal cleavage/methylation domain-containing protein [bacterium AH-315-F18]|nr:prepilin-type N-terminal cleavage/methylation domain-containing protein [bacterium AH-315-F18]